MSNIEQISNDIESRKYEEFDSNKAMVVPEKWKFTNYKCMTVSGKHIATPYWAFFITCFMDVRFLHSVYVF